MSRVVFCGNLPLDTRQREVEDLFHKYGCASSQNTLSCSLFIWISRHIAPMSGVYFMHVSCPDNNIWQSVEYVLYT